MRLLSRYAVLCLFLLMTWHLPPTPLLAEDSEDNATELPEVVVTAERSPIDLDDAARSVSIITAQQFDERIARTVPESLRATAGILVQRTNLGGGSPFIRGLVGNQVLILIDGVRMNNSTFRGGPNQYLNTIDPFFIDRIEVVRGPGSVLYGSDALGGTINIITHRRADFAEAYGVNGRLMSRFTTGEREATEHVGVESNVGQTLGMAVSGSLRQFGDIDPGGSKPLQAPYGYE
nr:TonB-dependent receptor plug domain-containing protein [bacterium]